MEDNDESHTDGYGSADDLRTLRKEVMRLRCINRRLRLMIKTYKQRK